VLGLAGYVLATRHVAPFVGAFTGAVIEITFGCILATGLRGVRDAAPASA
jgi:hypothetical protein